MSGPLRFWLGAAGPAAGPPRAGTVLPSANPEHKGRQPTDDERRVVEWFRAHGTRFGLRPASLSCRAVLNLGGFDNRSFTLDDGRIRLHLKLGARDAGAALQRWAAVHDVLEARYRAPRLLGVVEGGLIAGESLALVLEHVPGHPPDPLSEPEVLRTTLCVAATLHRDTGLGRQIRGNGGGRRTCADDLLETYVHRLRADLAECAATLPVPPFLAPGFASWAEAETDALQAAVCAHPAFTAPALATVHGDLSAANLLWSGERLCILDWDDLHAAGDGALDATNLLRPLLLAGRGGSLLSGYADAVGDPGVLARAPLYRRAMLLDEIIDSLADYAAADALPTHAPQVRARKRRAHQEALDAYRRETWD